MGIDRALLESVQAGGAPALRFYLWNPPCLSLGRNQPAAGVYDPAMAAARGIDIVRRPTGGRAVLHDRELTYCAVLPVGLLGSPRQSYAAINRALVSGLRRIGVPAMVVGGEESRDAVAEGRGGAGLPAAAGGRGPADALGPRPCFDAAAPGEVVAGGRKLIGSAQRREGAVLLQHGSLLLEGDQSLVLALRVGAAPVAAPAPADGRGHFAGGAAAAGGSLPPGFAAPVPATLQELLGQVPKRAELEAALAAGFEQTLGIRLEPVALSVAERAAARRWTARFAAPSWTWRR